MYVCSPTLEVSEHLKFLTIFLALNITTLLQFNWNLYTIFLAGVCFFVIINSSLLLLHKILRVERLKCRTDNFELVFYSTIGMLTFTSSLMVLTPLDPSSYSYVEEDFFPRKFSTCAAFLGFMLGFIELSIGYLIYEKLESNDHLVDPPLLERPIYFICGFTRDVPSYQIEEASPPSYDEVIGNGPTSLANDDRV